MIDKDNLFDLNRKITVFRTSQGGIQEVQMNNELAGRTVVITGGTSGIGLATAKRFLETGANVAICGRDEKRMNLALQEIKNEQNGGRLIGAKCDVLNKDQVEEFVNTTVDRFGGVDTLVNNAGQARLSGFDDIKDDEWREELELKFFSIILG